MATSNLIEAPEKIMEALLEAYNIQPKFNIISNSKNLLDSYIPPNDERLNKKGYKLISTDNPSNSKNR